MVDLLMCSRYVPDVLLTITAIEGGQCGLNGGVWYVKHVVQIKKWYVSNVLSSSGNMSEDPDEKQNVFAR